VVARPGCGHGASPQGGGSGTEGLAPAWRRGAVIPDDDEDEDDEEVEEEEEMDNDGVHPPNRAAVKPPVFRVLFF